jgi:hypothetical protein
MDAVAEVGRRIRCVYTFTCTTTGTVYVGSTSSYVVDRHRDHRSRLRGGRHRNKVLQAEWDEHGPLAFEFVVIEKLKGGSVEDLLLAEQRWIKTKRAGGRCYNIATASTPKQVPLLKEDDDG